MNNLKLLRIKRNLTQKQIASLLGISSQAYGNYEAERRDIETNFLKKLSIFYNVSIDYILGMVDEFGNKIEQNDAESPKTLTNLQTEETPKLVEVPITARSRGNKIPPKTYLITQEQLDELFNRLMKKKE